jgi:hypothetical protein
MAKLRHCEALVGASEALQAAMPFPVCRPSGHVAIHEHHHQRASSTQKNKDYQALALKCEMMMRMLQ